MATFTLLDTFPKQFFGISNGRAVPLAGGTLEAFEAGTETPLNMYSDGTGTVLGTSVTLDSRGEPMTVKNIWLKVGDSYKFRLKDADGVEIWTVDDVSTDQGIREFEDQITINVPSAKAPFVLNALAQGQLVTGLNADQVDGANVGTNNGDIVLRENLSSAAKAATENAQGVAEIGTQAEVDAGTDDARFITPKKLANFSGLDINQDSDIADNGYQEFSSGLILQWGSKASDGSVAFPTTFPNKCFAVIASIDGTSSDPEDYKFYVGNVATSGFVIDESGIGVNKVYWFAIGN